MSKLPRFFLENINTEKPVISGEDAKHIGRSLRMRPGELLTVCSCGRDYICEIKEITSEEVFLEIKSEKLCCSEPSEEFILYQAYPKQDKFEHIIQKSIELGITKIVPVLTQRCVARPDKKDFTKKMERFNKIAASAAKQSGRGIIPEVSEIISFEEAISQMKTSDYPIMLYENGGIRFSELEIKGKKSFSLLVGSEGGFDEKEAEYAKKAGITSIWLGERILRCETAPLTAITILMFITKNL